jgi:hypothetical protein
MSRTLPLPSPSTIAGSTARFNALFGAGRSGGYDGRHGREHQTTAAAPSLLLAHQSITALFHTSVAGPVVSFYAGAFGVPSRLSDEAINAFFIDQLLENELMKDVEVGLLPADIDRVCAWVRRLAPAAAGANHL